MSAEAEEAERRLTLELIKLFKPVVGYEERRQLQEQMRARHTESRTPPAQCTE